MLNKWRIRTKKYEHLNARRYERTKRLSECRSNFKLGNRNKRFTCVGHMTSSLEMVIRIG